MENETIKNLKKEVADSLEKSLETSKEGSTIDAKPKRVYIRRQSHPILTAKESMDLSRMTEKLLDDTFSTADIQAYTPAATIRDRLYLQAFLNPDSPTYLQEKESFKRAWGKDNIEGLDELQIAEYAYRTLRKYRQKGLISAYVTAIDCGIERRLSIPKQIMTGELKRITRSYSYVTDKVTGKRTRVCTNEVEQYPTFSERLKAVQELNKMTGEYHKRAIEAGQAKDELSRIRKQANEDMKKAREARDAVSKGDEMIDASSYTVSDDDEYDNAAQLPAVQTEQFMTGCTHE